MNEQEIRNLRQRRESAYFHTIFRRKSLKAEKVERQIRIMRKKAKQQEIA